MALNQLLRVYTIKRVLGSNCFSFLNLILDISRRCQDLFVNYLFARLLSKLLSHTYLPLRRLTLRFLAAFLRTTIRENR